MSKPKPYALITGANGGIGQALVLEFLEQNYKVIATDIHDESAIESEDVRYIAMDLNRFAVDENYANTFISNVKQITNTFGLKALINNAAIQILGSSEEIKREQWQTTFNVNLTAPFFLSQGLLPLLEAENGSIVNISSIHANLTKRKFVAYATSKGALSSLTRDMAVDLGDKIRINAIEPAAVKTEMLKASFYGQKEKLRMLSEFHPIKKITTPQDIAQLALSLSSDKFSSIHGECLKITGGIHICLSDPESVHRTVSLD